MFCSECGVKAAGKFCWSCGQPLQRAETESHDQEIVLCEITEDTPVQDWTTLIDCQALLAIPQVRQRINSYSAKAKSTFSGEDFLQCCDTIFTPLTGGVPLTIIAKIAQPISEKLGLKTGKERFKVLPEQPGTVLVAILCSLAQNGTKVRHVTQTPNSCTLQAAIPSDIWSLKGDLVVTVRAETHGTFVEAGLTIPGQIYDWGKCNRVLDRLFTDTVQLARAA